MLEIQTVEHIVIAVVGFLILVNILLNFNNIENDTINVIFKNWAYHKYFFITFIWGVLGGHFFLGSHKPIFGSNWWLPILIVFIIILILILIGRKLDKDIVLKRRYQILLLITGVLYGHFFWSQRHIPNIEFPWAN